MLAPAPDFASNAVQLQEDGDSGETNESTTPDAVREIAAEGASGAGGEIPHKAEMESAFGTDFSGVKSHTSPEATGAMGAQAYASGNDVVFGDSNPSKHLVAHELTHVLQQKQGVQLKGGVGTAGDQYEQQADAVADKVVQGKSVAGMVPGGGGGAASVQRSLDPAAAVQLSQLYSAAAAVQLSPVQFGFLGDAWNATGGRVVAAGRRVVAAGARAVRSAVAAVREWIDLLGPKVAFLNKVRDGSWAATAITGIKRDAHPKHKMWLDLTIWTVVVAAKAEALGFALKVAPIGKKKDLDKLDKEFAKWKAKRGPLLKKEVEAKVKEYRDKEAKWLQSYAKHATVTKDPVNPNKGNNQVALHFKPGAPDGTVTVETRVSYEWAVSDKAKAAGNKSIPAAEKKRFQERFQQQLDLVYTTKKNGVRPFRGTEPKDHLLESESPRWSNLLAKFKGKVTTVPKGKQHVAAKVTLLDPSEGTNGYISGDGKRANFNIRHADRGFDGKTDKTTGSQHTLAHEWVHMIGQPDEYAENSSRQQGQAGTETNATIKKYRAKMFDNAKAHFQKIIDDKTKSKADRDKARADLDALNNPNDADPVYGRKFYRFKGRTDIPDEAFAIRGSKDHTLPTSYRLQPGRGSQRGGTTISASKEDEKRISDAGNRIHAYHREGILVELNNMIKGTFSPNVAFEHNFKDMKDGKKAKAEVDKVREAFKKIDAPVGKTKEPVEGAGNESGGGHDHAGHDHDE